MDINQYYIEEDGNIRFTRQQASNFAKDIADDFNPLHDIDAKRFCVPGDLLFALILCKYGITKHMQFTFSGMVTDEVTLLLPEEAPHISIQGTNGKEYLSVEHTGDNSNDDSLIKSLTESYVTFSGHTFPHILIPLMTEKDVMINPDRPMVMYHSMLIDLDELALSNVELKLDEEKTIFKMEGKRGNVCLAFNLTNDGKVIGRGEKHMVVSGLKPYEKTVVDKVSEDYALWKKAYHSED